MHPVGLLGSHASHAATYHHANVGLGLHVHRLVQHDVHELVEATQSACDVPVGVEDNYGGHSSTQQQQQQQHTGVRRGPLTGCPAAACSHPDPRESFLSMNFFSSGGWTFGILAALAGWLA